jgi:two-component system response regulator MtrA
MSCCGVLKTQLGLSTLTQSHYINKIRLHFVLALPSVVNRNEARVSERILAIDDDPFLLQLIEKSLLKDGYQVILAADGQEGLKLLAERKPHLVLLDIMLPRIDGWEICNRIRKVSTIPVIILTARGSQSDVVRGLQMGADDYLVKPFYPAELQARVSAVLRRASMPPTSQKAPLRFGNGSLIIDPAERLVTLDGNLVDLTRTEFDLLLFMAYRPGRILTTETIFENVWSYDAEANIESVKWYVWRLRKKIERDSGNPQHIITERGVGYRFVPNYGVQSVRVEAG